MIWQLYDTVMIQVFELTDLDKQCQDLPHFPFRLKRIDILPYNGMITIALFFYLKVLMSEYVQEVP